MKNKITKRLILSNLLILIFALSSFYAITIYNINSQAKAQVKQQLIAESSLIAERTSQMNSIIYDFEMSNFLNSLQKEPPDRHFSQKDNYIFHSQNNSASIHIFCNIENNLLVFPEESNDIFKRMSLDRIMQHKISNMFSNSKISVPTEISISKENNSSEYYLVLLTPYEDESSIIVSIIALEFVNALTTSNIFSFLVVLFVLVILSFVIIYWQAMGITSPLNQLTKVSELYANHDYSEPFIIKTGDEIESLSHSIQSMVESIIVHEKAQTSLFRNLSHELKTPLTAISGYAQNIQNGYYDNSDLPLSIIQEECQRIHQILDDLIFLSKIDSKVELFTFKPYDIVEILTNALEKVESIAILKEIDIEYLPTKEIFISCDKEKLMRVFINVLSNGLRHSNDLLKLEILEEDYKVHIIISDNGNGFKKSKLDKLFISNTGETVDGNGLGLLIVHEIVKRHNGSIEVKNIEPLGAEIKLTFTKL